MVAPFNRDNAKKALLVLKEVFDKYQTELILVGGTALGAYRDKDFCAGDKDIDVAVLHEDFKKVIWDVAKDFATKKCISMIYAYPYSYARAMHTNIFGVRVDIVDYDLKKGIRFSAHSKKDYALVYPARLFENMADVEFHGKMFKIPTPTEEYLTIHYTDSWRVPDPVDFGGRNKEWGFFNK